MIMKELFLYHDIIVTYFSQILLEMIIIKVQQKLFSLIEMLGIVFY